MTTHHFAKTTTDLFDRLGAYLSESLGLEDLSLLIPDDDPLRVWWSPAADSPETAELMRVLKGAEDFVTLSALVQYARLKKPLPPGLEREFAEFMRERATALRNQPGARVGAFHVFLSYSHDDEWRVKSIVSILQEAGVKVFRDVEQILPGESIVGALHGAMAAIPRAVIIVSKNYVVSEWTGKELEVFLARRAEQQFAVLPVLIDDIELPDSLKDIFTIDLRGYKGDPDREWALGRLQKLIDVCVKKSSP